MVSPRSDPFGPDIGPPPPPPVRGQRAPLPPFCTALIAVCVLVFLGRALRVPGFDREDWALIGPAVAAGEWWRVLSATLVHADPVHILVNMITVVTLGFPVERILGTRRMLAVSLVSALGSAAMVLALGFDQPVVGASGMILGWAGVLLPVINRESRQQLLMQLVLVVIISLQRYVSWQGHLGGFLAGLACGGVLRVAGRRFDVLWPALAGALALAIVGLARSGGLHVR
jgi:rhomboid protease GluP